MNLRSQHTLTTPELVSAASQVSSPATLRAVVRPCRRSCLKLTACPGFLRSQPTMDPNVVLPTQSQILRVPSVLAISSLSRLEVSASYSAPMMESFTWMIS